MNFTKNILFIISRFFAASFRLELTKKKLAYLTFDQVKQVILMLVNEWGDKDEAQEPTLDKGFLASLKDIKILLDREKEHKNAVISALKTRYIWANLTNYRDLTNSFW